jgi:hypothetical protein
MSRPMNNLTTANYLPPELLADEHHPSNSEYFRNMRSVERAMVDASQKAGSRDTQIAKMHHRGMKNKDIAEEMSLHPVTVSKAIRSPGAQKVLWLAQYLTMLREGPTLEHRKRTLWEMANQNQQTDPKVSISAIQEMNRMDGVGKDRPDTKIEVTINSQLLPRGNLDK